MKVYHGLLSGEIRHPLDRRAEEKYKAKIDKALEPVIDELLHPEKFDSHTGAKIQYPSRPWVAGQAAGKSLRPRDRLGRRMTLLLVLKKLEAELMKEILDDKEAAEDAKANAAALETERDADDAVGSYLGGERWDP